MKKITICIFILSFLLYRPYQLQDSGLKYGDDDDVYFSHAIAITQLEFPTTGKFPVGSGMMAAPFVFVFSMLDKINGVRVTDVHSDAAVKSWTQFGFVFSSMLYFWLSCYLLFKTLRLYFSENHSLVAVILMVLLQGVPLYVYRRPIFSHVYELFLQSLLVYFIVRYDRMNEEGHYLSVMFICFIIGMVVVVRYNNAIIALSWPIVIWGIRNNGIINKNRLKKVLYAYGILFLPMLTLFIIPEIYYSEWTRFNYFIKVSSILLTNLQNLTLLFYFKRLLHVLIGIDWGLFFTAPFIILSLISFCYFEAPFKRLLLIPSLALFITFFMFVLSWRSQGAWYGYRYIIFSAIPILTLPMANLIKHEHQRYGKKIYIPILFISLLPLFSMLCFEGNPDTLTLSGSDKNGNWIFWGNPTFQLEVWKTFLFNVKGFIIAVFKGGPLYIIYLLAVFLKKTQLLPPIVLEKYPRFELMVLFKSLIIYLLPFAFYSIYMYFNKWNLGTLLGRTNRTRSK